MIPGKQYSPEELLKLAWSRKSLILLCTFAGAVALYALSLAIPNRYESETLVLVVPNRVRDEVANPTIKAIEDRLSTISQQIQSRSSLEQFIIKYDLYSDLRGKESLDSLVLRMREDMDVAVVKSDLFRVRFASENPATAQLMASELASAYIAEDLRAKSEAVKNTSGFLKVELNNARLRLEEQERKLEEYRRRHYGELPSQLPSNQDALAATRMELHSVRESMARARERRELLDSQIADIQTDRGTAGPNNSVLAPGVDSGRAVLEQQLAAARARFAEVAAKLTSDHPDWSTAARKVREAESDLAAHRPGAPVVLPGETSPT